MKSKVYFSKTITPENVVEMYKVLNKELPIQLVVPIENFEVINLIIVFIFY